jgi:Xaa-Pro aminopeptidase
VTTGRVETLVRLSRRAGVDGVLVQDPANVLYLSGFTGEGCLLITPAERILLTDARYDVQARTQTRGFAVSIFRAKVPELAATIKKTGVSRLGFEANSTPFAFVGELKTKLRSLRLTPMDAAIDGLRLIKTVDEVKLIREAIGIAGEAFQVALPELGKGRREIEFAALLEFECRRRGAERMAFDTIVASGVRGALPHGVASSKKIRSGELVTIDWGVVHRGYHSDETQTVACGKTTAKQRDLYYVVKEAHDLAIESTRPGMTFRQLDAVARDYIVARGFGKNFGHGLGHGVGLKIHEDPRINWQGEGRIEENMVFTIEPGIYIPDWGGIRIESVVRARKGPPEVLTGLHKGLRVVG